MCTGRPLARPGTGAGRHGTAFEPPCALGAAAVEALHGRLHTHRSVRQAFPTLSLAARSSATTSSFLSFMCHWLRCQATFSCIFRVTPARARTHDSATHTNTQANTLPPVLTVGQHGDLTCVRPCVAAYAVVRLLSLCPIRCFCLVYFHASQLVSKHRLVYRRSNVPITFALL